MISGYVQAAMSRAKYELLPDGEGFYAEIPELRGICPNADSLEECRQQLIEVIEGWIITKIRLLRKAGFAGPESGANHAYLRKGGLTLTIPNVHRGDIGKNLPARLPRQAGISRDEWEQL